MTVSFTAESEGRVVSETGDIHRRGGHSCLLFTTSRRGGHVHFCRQEAHGVRDLCDFSGRGCSSGYCSPPSHPKKKVWILMFPVHFHAAASVWLLSAAPQESLSHYSHVLHLSKFPEKNGMWMGCQQPRWTKSLWVKTFSPWTLNWTQETMQHTETNVFSRHPPPSLFGALGGHGGWVRGGGDRGPWSDPPTLHERQELFRNLCQDVLRQSSHAKHLVSRAVDVVTERNKLHENKHSSPQKNQIYSFTQSKTDSSSSILTFGDG